MSSLLKVQLELEESNLARPVSLTLQLDPVALEAPKIQATPPDSTHPSKFLESEQAPPSPCLEMVDVHQTVDEFEMALESAWEEESPPASYMDSEDQRGLGEECAPSRLPGFLPQAEDTNCSSDNNLPPPVERRPLEGQILPPETFPPPLQPPSYSSPEPCPLPPVAEGSHCESEECEPESTFDRLLAVPVLQAQQGQEHSELSAPYVCDAADDSDADSNESDELLDNEIYKRFEQAWPIDRSSLEELSDEYIESALSVFEKMEECRRPAPYEPYVAPQRRFELKLPETERVSTPPPVALSNELPPPKMVSVKKRANIPLLVQNERATIARRQASERRAHGECYEEYLERTQGIKPKFLLPRTN